MVCGIKRVIHDNKETKFWHISEGWELWYAGVGHTLFHGKQSKHEAGRCLGFGLAHIRLPKKMLEFLCDFVGMHFAPSMGGG